MADLMEKLVDKWIADSESYKMAMNNEKLKERTQVLAKHKYEQLCLCISELRGALAMAQFETRNCNLSDVMARLFDDIAKNSNADRSRVVAGFDKGKLCFYELDLHEETVKRYLTTVSLNVP